MYTEKHNLQDIFIKSSLLGLDPSSFCLVKEKNYGNQRSCVKPIIFAFNRPDTNLVMESKQTQKF